MASNGRQDGAGAGGAGGLAPAEGGRPAAVVEETHGGGPRVVHLHFPVELVIQGTARAMDPDELAEHVLRKLARRLRPP